MLVVRLHNRKTELFIKFCRYRIFLDPEDEVSDFHICSMQHLSGRSKLYLQQC